MYRYISLFVLLALSLACGGGGGGASTSSSSTASTSGTAGSSTTQYLASNVVFSASGLAKAGDQLAVVDTTTKVLAANIVVSTGKGEIKSDNLQTALDEEIAVEVSTALQGTWTIKNITSNPDYKSTTGEIVFTSNSGTGKYDFTLSSGRTVVPGLFTKADYDAFSNAYGYITGTGTAEVVGSRCLYLSWSYIDRSSGKSFDNSSVVDLPELRKGRVVFVGGGSNRSISILTKK